MMPRWAQVRGGQVVTVVEALQAPGSDWLPADGGVGPGMVRLGNAWGMPQPLVPAVVTARQARLALRAAGLLDSVEAAIDAIPDATARAVARITWDHSQEVQRTNPLVVQLGAALGLTTAQVDALFVQAGSL